MNIELKDWVNEQILPYLPSDRIRQGDKILFRCPICGDSRKNSLKKRGYYYTKTASYHCFNCDVSLTGMKLLQFLSGEEYDDIKSKFFKTIFDGKHYNSLSSYGSSPKEGPKKDNIFNLKPVLKPEHKQPLSEKAREYLKNRMVLDAPFLHEQIYSYTTKKGSEFILLPWRLNGIDAYFQLNDFLKLSTSGLKYIFPKNQDKLIYGLDNIDISFPYLICFEGVYDSLFIPNGIAIGGKNLTTLQQSILKKRFPNHRIVMALDNDKPGLKATANTLIKNSNAMTLYFKWFESNTTEKDINDYVKSKQNVNIFCDKKKVESMIVDSITMKMWLSKNGYLKSSEYDKSKQTWKQRQVQQCPHWDIFSQKSKQVLGKIQTDIQIGT